MTYIKPHQVNIWRVIGGYIAPVALTIGATLAMVWRHGYAPPGLVILVAAVFLVAGSRDRRALAGSR